MLYTILKAALSGIIIAAVSEIARRSPAAGALVASLPLISILAMIWLWQDTGDANLITLPTAWLILFLVLPLLLRNGMQFYLALFLSCALTAALYLLMVWGLRKFGVTF